MVNLTNHGVFFGVETERNTDLIPQETDCWITDVKTKPYLSWYIFKGTPASVYFHCDINSIKLRRKHASGIIWKSEDFISPGKK